MELLTLIVVAIQVNARVCICHMPQAKDCVIMSRWDDGLDEWITGTEVLVCHCGRTFFESDGGCEGCDVEPIEDEEWKNQEHASGDLAVCSRDLRNAARSTARKAPDVDSKQQQWGLGHKKAWRNR